MLNGHAEYLTSLTPRAPSASQKPLKKMSFRPHSVHATEVEETNEDECETEADGEGENEATQLAAAVEAVFRKWHGPNSIKIKSQSNNKPRDISRNVQAKAMEAKNQCVTCNERKTDNGPQPIYCYGCQAPGVYKRDCPNCQNAKNE